MRTREHPAVISGKNDVLRIDPRQLKVDPGFNVRDLDAPSARPALDELKEQIRFEGVRVPLEVRMRGDDLFVVSGHRRHKVVMELIDEGAEILSVPALAEPATVSEADRIAGLVTMNAGLPLSQLEKAEVVRRLLGYGWDREKIRQRLGFKTTQSVADLEANLALPEAVKDEVRAGTISATTARQVVRREGPERATETISSARQTAQDAGKSRVTPRNLQRPSPAPSSPSRPPVKNETVTEIFAGTLRDIATQSGDPRSRKQARSTLTLQGFTVPPEEPQPESDFTAHLHRAIRAYYGHDVDQNDIDPDSGEAAAVERIAEALAKVAAHG